jgi:hypothetical protein
MLVYKEIPFGAQSNPFERLTLSQDILSITRLSQIRSEQMQNRSAGNTSKFKLKGRNWIIE